MKPILYNTEMVRGLLNGTKTVTRRVVKEPYYIDDEEMSRGSGLAMHRGTNMTDGMPYPDQPYCPGDILYVRETWRVQSARRFDADARIEFKAGGDMARIQFPGGGDQYHSRREYDAFVARWADDKWHPSVHMPREAARVFLRVTDVRVERLQDITDEECMAEGIQAWTKGGKLYKYYPADHEGDHPACDWQDCPKTPREAMRKIWNNCYSKPQPVKVKGVIDHYESYPWVDIQETRTYRGKPWYVIGNPWTWGIEFERCEKPYCSNCGAKMDKEVRNV